jgi:hypothetical protein
MPFKRKAQRRKFAQLLVEGKILSDTFEDWNRETGSKKLPERVGPGTAVERKLLPDSADEKSVRRTVSDRNSSKTGSSPPFRNPMKHPYELLQQKARGTCSAAT